MFKPRKRSLVGDHAVVFQLSNGKVQRRQSQTLLRGVQRKDERQRTQVVARKISVRHKVHTDGDQKL